MFNRDKHYPLAPESDDLHPLPAAHRQGLMAVAVMASISFASSAVVLLYLTFKLVRWNIKEWKQRRRNRREATFTTRRHRSSSPNSNQQDQTTPESVDLSLGIAERHFRRSVVGGGSNTNTQGDGRAPGKKRYPNQFLLLLYNLLFADLHQAAAFLLNAVWIGKDGIEVHDPTCFVQGWLVSTGDLASSCFITAIAVHTYLAVVWKYRPPQRALYVTIVGLWLFVYLLALLGPVTTHNGRVNGGFYVRAAAWCWVSVKYETHRLVLHYLFIFIALAITSVLYTLIFLSLRKNHCRRVPDDRSWQPPLPSSTTTSASRPSSSNDYRDPENPPPSSPSRKKNAAPSTNTRPTSHDRRHRCPSGQHKAFLLYPVIYVVCTAPLALGRVATMAKVDVPISYFCVAGALIGSNGWLDVLLWGLTRHKLLFGSDIDSEENGLDTFAFMRTPHDRRFGNIVWVEGGGEGDGNGDREGGDVRDGGRWAGVGRGWGWVKRRLGMRWKELRGEGTRRGEGRFKGRGRGLRTTSQESLRGSGSKQLGQGRDEMMSSPLPPMSGIHMDMVTSVVVVERKDLEKGKGVKGGCKEHWRAGGGGRVFNADGGDFGGLCKDRSTGSGSGSGQGDDVPVLQDPSGYLSSTEAEEGEVEMKQDRYG